MEPKQTMGKIFPKNVKIVYEEDGKPKSFSVVGENYQERYVSFAHRRKMKWTAKIIHGVQGN